MHREETHDLQAEPHLSETLLEIEGLEKRFGGHQVLRGVDLTLPGGAMVGLVGNNGQGKTTLIKLILGLLRPDAGAVRLRGAAVGFPRTRGEKRDIGYMPEAVRFYPRLSGARTLRFFARLKGAPKDDVPRLLALVGLAQAAGEPVGTYSKGMRQRLGLAQALLGNPSILLLDEPTNGLDPEGIHDFYRILGDLQARGVGILTASHMLAEISPRLQSLALLRDGRIVRQGALRDLIAQSGLASHIKVVLQAPHGETIARLEALGAAPASNGHPHSYQIACQGPQKLEALRQVLESAGHIADVQLSEPGLEELFRHYQSPPPAVAGSGAGDGEGGGQ